MKVESIRSRSGGLFATALATFAISSAHATITVNGARDIVNETEYIERAVQATTSGWGASDFLANLHAVQNVDLLNIFIGGSVQGGNCVYLFIDSKPGGFNTITNNLINASFGEEWRINNLGTTGFAGLTFEAGFTADYVVHVKGEGTSAYVNRFDLQAGSRNYVGDAGFANTSGGFISDARTSWINLAGDAQDHLNGIEIALNKARLGVPVGLGQTVKVMAVIINNDANYGSNQVLDSRTADTNDIAAAVNSINFETEPGTQTISITVDNPDTDNDNMPDSWENLYGLNVGIDDSGFDNLDTDNSTNLQEYQRGTIPNIADTDGDTVKDGWESDTGNWVSGTATGTDPLDTDSDNDGLTDGQENNSGNWLSSTDTSTNPNLADTDGDTLSDTLEDNSGTYVSASLPGTNPNLADTDVDGENDGTEVFHGTIPTSNLSSSALLGNPLIDGTLDTPLYGAAVAVQTIQTSFGDNTNEWNAAYGKVINGKLYLTFTGNLEANFNKLNIFVDSKAGGSTTFTSSGNDGSGVMNGMKFDAGFRPDYHLIARRGFSQFDFDMAVLGTSNFSSYGNLFGGSTSGRGITGTGSGNSQPIRIAYDGSNTAGIGGDAGGGAADQVAAAAVTTGLELCIDLADLGNPAGPITVMLLQTGSDHTFLSNQTLVGLPDDTGSLGGPPSIVDFGLFNGNQFFFVGGTGGYADWAIVNADHGALNDDFDGDGMKNGIEYFFGETGSSFTANPGPVNGTVKWPDANAAGVDFRIWTSQTLAAGSWTNVTGAADTTSEPGFIKYTLPTVTPKLFVRFEVFEP